MSRRDGKLPAIVDHLARFGDRVNSRYGTTREILGFQYKYRVGEVPKRNLMNMRIGWLEVCMLMGEFYDLSLFERVAPKADLALFTPQMAYGPRVLGQVETVIETLRTSPDSRQCVLFIGKPADGMTSSQPCTTTIQFFVRNKELKTITTMRSWDAIKGLPYDLMMFGALTQVVAHVLGLTAGESIVNAGSFHVYEADLEKSFIGVTATFSVKEDAPRDYAVIKQQLADDARQLAPMGNMYTPSIFTWKQ